MDARDEQIALLRARIAELSQRARLVKDYRDVPPVEADEARLAQVFINLLINAVQALPEDQPDWNEITVFLCDLVMPEMTGMELHAQLARTTPEQAARMIFVTGGAFTRAAQEFLERVPNKRLDKPFDPEIIRALVQNQMR